MDAVLVPMTPGEFLDRWTILLVKKEHIDAARKPRVLSEINGLAESQAVVLSRVERDLQLRELCNQLKEVNTRLWHLEDAIRCVGRKLFGQDDAYVPDASEVYIRRFAYLGHQVHVYNWKRTLLKSFIDKAFGVGSEVKLYAGQSNG